jgi:branched-chain amino acid transport system permease protein
MGAYTFRRDLVIGLIALAILLALPFVLPSRVVLDFIIRVAAYGIFATALNLLVGFGGMVSFGQGMFFGGGAYAFGLIMQKTGASVPLAILGSIGFCALLALVVGSICVRLKEIYFSFLTLAFQMLLHSIIISWQSLTGGDQGLMGGISRAPFLGINLADHKQLYWFACVLLILCLLAMRHILQTPFGYTLRMVRDNADRAKFLGIEVWQIRLKAFVIAGVFSGIGGILMGLFVSGAFPEFAYWTTSGDAIIMIMIGGLQTFMGPMTGAVVLLALNDLITKVTEYHGLALGIAVLIFTLGFKRGIADFLQQIVARSSARGRS